MKVGRCLRQGTTPLKVLGASHGLLARAWMFVSANSCMTSTQGLHAGNHILLQTLSLCTEIMRVCEDYEDYETMQSQCSRHSLA